MRTAMDGDPTENSHDWSSLPVVILAKVFGYLRLADLVGAGQVCRHWHQMLGSAVVWHQVEFDVRGSADRERWQLSVIKRHGALIHLVTLRVDQSKPDNRLLAVNLLRTLAGIPDRSIRSLRIVFSGENPLFYAGLEFVDALRAFLAVEGASLRCTLESLDISQMPVMFQDWTFEPLATIHWQTLRYLDLQNKQFICQVTPACMRTLVETCVELQDVRVCHFSVTDDVLLMFTNPQRRRPLVHLSLFCRRQEKYCDHDLSKEAWSALTAHYQHLAVTLKFDFTCTLRKTRDILKPNIPIWNLYLENHVTAYEICFAAQNYAGTLRKLVVQCRYNVDIQESLLAVAEACRQLRSLHVMCVLDQDVIDQIFELLPELSVSGQYTLKSEMELGPWNTDEILDRLILPVTKQ